MSTIKSAAAVVTVLAGITVLHMSSAASREVLTDRCSGEVAFTPTFDGKPTAHGSVILKRGGDGYSPVSTFSVKTDKDGYVRWWCHSTIGNVFDPGTWRVRVDGAALFACLVSPGVPVDATNAACQQSVKIGSAAFDGWTPERSRCGDHSTKLQARLGPDRLLTTECLGK